MSGKSRIDTNATSPIVSQHLIRSGAINYLVSKYIANVSTVSHRCKIFPIFPMRKDESYQIANEMILRYFQRHKLKYSSDTFRNESNITFTHPNLPMVRLKITNSQDPLHGFWKMMKNTTRMRYHDTQMIQALVMKVPHMIDKDTKSHFLRILEKAGDSDYHPNFTMQSESGVDPSLSEAYKKNNSNRYSNIRREDEKSNKKSNKKTSPSFITGTSTNNNDHRVTPIKQSNNKRYSQHDQKNNNKSIAVIGQLQPVDAKIAYTYQYVETDSSSNKDQNKRKQNFPVNTKQKNERQYESLEYSESESEKVLSNKIQQLKQSRSTTKQSQEDKKKLYDKNKKPTSVPQQIASPRIYKLSLPDDDEDQEETQTTKKQINKSGAKLESSKSDSYEYYYSSDSDDEKIDNLTKKLNNAIRDNKGSTTKTINSNNRDSRNENAPNQKESRKTSVQIEKVENKYKSQTSDISNEKSLKNSIQKAPQKDNYSISKKSNESTPPKNSPPKNVSGSSNKNKSRSSLKPEVKKEYSNNTGIVTAFSNVRAAKIEEKKSSPPKNQSDFSSSTIRRIPKLELPSKISYKPNANIASNKTTSSQPKQSLKQTPPAQLEKSKQIPSRVGTNKSENKQNDQVNKRNLSTLSDDDDLISDSPPPAMKQLLESKKRKYQQKSNKRSPRRISSSSSSTSSSFSLHSKSSVSKQKAPPEASKNLSKMDVKQKSTDAYKSSLNSNTSKPEKIAESNSKNDKPKEIKQNERSYPIKSQNFSSTQNVKPPQQQQKSSSTQQHNHKVEATQQKQPNNYQASTAAKPIVSKLIETKSTIRVIEGKQPQNKDSEIKSSSGFGNKVSSTTMNKQTDNKQNIAPIKYTVVDNKHNASHSRYAVNGNKPNKYNNRSSPKKSSIHNNEERKHKEEIKKSEFDAQLGLQVIQKRRGESRSVEPSRSINNYRKSYDTSSLNGDRHYDMNSSSSQSDSMRIPLRKTRDLLSSNAMSDLSMDSSSSISERRKVPPLKVVIPYNDGHAAAFKKHYDLISSSENFMDSENDPIKKKIRQHLMKRSSSVINDPRNSNNRRQLDSSSSSSKYNLRNNASQKYGNSDAHKSKVEIQSVSNKSASNANERSQTKETSSNYRDSSIKKELDHSNIEPSEKSRGRASSVNPQQSTLKSGYGSSSSLLASKNTKSNASSSISNNKSSNPATSSSNAKISTSSVANKQPTSSIINKTSNNASSNKNSISTASSKQIKDVFDVQITVLESQKLDKVDTFFVLYIDGENRAKRTKTSRGKTSSKIFRETFNFEINNNVFNLVIQAKKEDLINGDTPIATGKLNLLSLPLNSKHEEWVKLNPFGVVKLLMERMSKKPNKTQNSSKDAVVYSLANTLEDDKKSNSSHSSNKLSSASRSKNRGKNNVENPDLKALLRLSDERRDADPLIKSLVKSMSSIQQFNDDDHINVPLLSESSSDSDSNDSNRRRKRQTNKRKK